MVGPGAADGMVQKATPESQECTEVYPSVNMWNEPKRSLEKKVGPY